MLGTEPVFPSRVIVGAELFLESLKKVNNELGCIDRGSLFLTIHGLDSRVNSVVKAIAKDTSGNESVCYQHIPSESMAHIL